MPPGRPQFKGAQRGGKSTEKEPTQPKSWRNKKARVSYCLLFREIKRRDVWHSRISERKTSRFSPNYPGIPKKLLKFFYASVFLDCKLVIVYLTERL